ncbi:MAG: hypothetical protein QM767_29845 [Anaeromyxobacter sp.]
MDRVEQVEPLTDEAIRTELRKRAVEGYSTDDGIIRWALDVFSDLHGDLPGLEDRVRGLAEQVFDERRQEELDWPVPTDCDRLDRAFDKLEKKGVLARQDFACCQNCGHHEIGVEIEAAPGPVHGYTFFHQQDTESAAEGQGLFLAYGAVLPPGSPDEQWQSSCLDVGHEVAAALRAEGLQVQWDGSQDTRIRVDLTWRRRRRRG